MSCVTVEMVNSFELPQTKVWAATHVAQQLDPGNVILVTVPGPATTHPVGRRAQDTPNHSHAATELDINGFKSLFLLTPFFSTLLNYSPSGLESIGTPAAPRTPPRPTQWQTPRQSNRRSRTLRRESKKRRHNSRMQSQDYKKLRRLPLSTPARTCPRKRRWRSSRSTWRKS